jgi:Protein tyrosine and serine/threonine kinase
MPVPPGVPIPVRWCGPELFDEDGANFHFPGSDTWMFALTLVEFANQARRPYEFMTNLEVKEFVLGGKRLDISTDLAVVERSSQTSYLTSIAEILVGCMHADPAQRPSWTAILKACSSSAKDAADPGIHTEEEVDPNGASIVFHDTFDSPDYVRTTKHGDYSTVLPS